MIMKKPLDFQKSKCKKGLLSIQNKESTTKKNTHTQKNPKFTDSAKKLAVTDSCLKLSQFVLLVRFW